MKTILTTCAVLALLAGPAFAQGTDNPKHRGVFEQADADKDGTVTKDEFAAAQSQYFDTIDANHDGKLEKDEIKAHRTAMRGNKDHAKKKGAEPILQPQTAPEAAHQ